MATKKIEETRAPPEGSGLRRNEAKYWYYAKFNFTKEVGNKE